MSSPQRRSSPTFPQLLARFGSSPNDDDVTVVSMSACLSSGEDPRNLFAYLAGLGLPVSSLDDLLGVNDLDGEDELGAFKVKEGVAVSVASHSAWVLFQP